MVSSTTFWWILDTILSEDWKLNTLSQISSDVALLCSWKYALIRLYMFCLSDFIVGFSFLD